MINRVRAMLQDPARGWDPVSPEYAESYSQHEWTVLDADVITRIECAVGGLSGKRVLDLGGGPGQFAVAFAKRGAHVTWHDVSNNYLTLARRRAGELAAGIEWSLGYLEDAARLPAGSYDLVFNRICWYYCMNDRAFADLVWSLLKPGGVAYVDTNNSRVLARRRPGAAQALAWVNERFWYKAGHPFPPPGRVPGLFAAKSPLKLEASFIDPTSERILVWKATDTAPAL